MNIVFRTDASIQIGSGHVMRCLTLATLLRMDGAQISFVCCELPGHLCDHIRAKGFAVDPLPAPQKSISSTEFNKQNRQVESPGLEWQIDAEQTETVLANNARNGVDWLVVDHYALDRRWEACMRQLVKNIMVIDDLANRPHDCDLLLDQNFYEDLETRYEGLVPTNCRKLLGPKYALLRPEFRDARKNLRKRDGSIRRILVYFGNVDPTNETLKALRAIQLLGLSDVAVDVVVGASNFNHDDIKRFCSAMPNTVFHSHVDDMATLMTKSDLCLGAGGATTWERCCVGLPTITISIAKNQEETTKTMAEAGLVLYLGKNNAVTSETIFKTINGLIANPALVRFMSRATALLVDGRGALRVKNQLLVDDLKLRPARDADCSQIYSWRNAEENRKHAFNPAPIDASEHETWFRDSLENPDKIMLIGESSGEQVGVLRYDLCLEHATVSIYLVPGKHGQGYGTRLLKAGSSWLLKHHPKIRRVVAEVLADNPISENAFISAGFYKHINVFKQDLRND